MAWVAAQLNSNYVFRLIGLGTTNSNLINGAPCMLSGFSISNINTAPVYLKIYDKATAPVIGTDTPVMTFLIPGNTAGAGSNVTIDGGVYMVTGLGIGLTSALADNSTSAVSANEQLLNIFYRKA